MTINQQKKILTRIQQIETEISELKAVRTEIAKSGYKSASLGSGGGSKSYTRMDIGEITTLINQLVEELNGLRILLGKNSTDCPKSIYHIYF